MPATVMPNVVSYTLGASANYKFDIVRMGYNNYDKLAYYYKSDFPDVEVKKRKVASDLALLHRNFLITINGYVYSSVYSEDRLYLPNANKSMLRSRANAVGLVNLAPIGKDITKTPITAQMVTSDLYTLAYDKVFITMPEPVEQPLLIMAGYIIPYDPDHFYRVADNAFVLCLSKMQYTEKIYELSRYRDIFKDLGIPVSPLNEHMVDAQLLRSEETIKKFLSLSNSFMVDLKSTPIQTRKIFLEHSNVPGNFRTTTIPKLPLFVGYGKLCEYMVDSTSYDKYVLYTQDAHYNNHLLSSMREHDLAVVNDSRRPGATHRLTHAFFLEMKL